MRRTAVLNNRAWESLYLKHLKIQPFLLLNGIVEQNEKQTKPEKQTNAEFSDRREQ